MAINNVHVLHDLDLAWNKPAEAARFADHATNQPPRLRSTIELLRRAFSCPSNDRYGMVSDDFASSEVVETADAGSRPVVTEEQNADLITHGEAVIRFEEPINGDAARLWWHSSRIQGKLPRDDDFGQKARHHRTPLALAPESEQSGTV